MQQNDERRCRRCLTRFHSAAYAVQELAPGEASVYFQMGKLYKRLGQLDAALKHLSHALDLRPASGDANLIKAAIEKLRQPDEADEEEM